MRRRPFLLLAAGALSCGRSSREGRAVFDAGRLASMSWSEVERRARDTTVRFGMWAGEEPRNRYYRGPVRERLRRDCGVDLKIVPAADVAEIVAKLLNEKAAGKARGGSVDMVWINGENFRAAKAGHVLWGPFAETLPNIRNYHPESWRSDFGTPVDGLEAPWQRAQFVMAYDTSRTPDPPRTIPALGEWIDAHPGRFTYIAPPDFTGSAFLRHVLYHFGGGAQPFREGFEEQLYRQAARTTFAWLNERELSLWRRGGTYPATLRELNRLFANSEVDFAMSYGPSFASEAIERGEFPPTTRTFVFDTGTIANYNFLAIPFNAGNIAGALVAINHLLSFEAALDAARVLRTTFPLDLSRLKPEQRDMVSALPRGIATLPGEVLAAHSLPEADARYLELLERDWRAEVLLR